MDEEIKKELRLYLTGKTTLRQFHLWLEIFTWEEQPSELISTVKLRMAEFTSGHWTGDELKEMLAALV